MSAPPIPQRLARRPTLGGLVVPYVALTIGDRIHFGQTRGMKAARCIIDGLCQVDGKPLGAAPFLFLGTQSAIDEGFSSEAPLHPECAAYSAKACPMLNGAMRHYAKHDRSHTGEPCGDPGCDCGGWVSDPADKAGAPSEPWFQIWVSGYQLGVTDDTKPLTLETFNGAVFKGQIIKTRPIRRTEAAT